MSTVTQTNLKPYYQLIEDLCHLPILDLEKDYHIPQPILALQGFTSTESSFKIILALGLILLAYEHKVLEPNQPIIESTSGSLGVALARVAKMLNHPLILVSDTGIAAFTQKKIELMGAQLVFADTGHYEGGAQAAREKKLEELLALNPHYYNFNQHHNPLNPEVYRRWLAPYLHRNLPLESLTAGIFCVGTGGHFVGIASVLSQYNIPSYVAERHGSITFGGTPAPSLIRGAGNQSYIPKVIQSNLGLVKGVERISDSEAKEGLKELSAHGIIVGGTSGLCYSGAKRLSLQPQHKGKGKVLTFFGDRGELYWETLYKEL